MGRPGQQHSLTGYTPPTHTGSLPSVPIQSPRGFSSPHTYSSRSPARPATSLSCMYNYFIGVLYTTLPSLIPSNTPTPDRGERRFQEKGVLFSLDYFLLNRCKSNSFCQDISNFFSNCNNSNQEECSPPPPPPPNLHLSSKLSCPSLASGIYTLPRVLRIELSAAGRITPLLEHT